MATVTQTIPGDEAAVAPQKRDFRQEVTDSIVQMLEKGVAPWQKPWEPSASALGMPMNPTTEKSYRGGNAIHLMATALRRGYDDPRWMTYKQAAEEGWQVRKGEKGTQIEFLEVKESPSKSLSSSPREGKGEDTPERARISEKRRLIHRVYTVFNAKQVDGVPTAQAKEHSTFEAIHAGEQILQNSGAKIVHDQPDRAFYSRAEDTIHLPPKDSFRGPAAYYGTSLHELSHWSGHPSRLNRPTLTETYRFGDVNYAKEELRAELASVFMAAERGIPHDPEQHAAYVGSWIKSLKEDKNQIFRAAHDASAAADFLLALERDRSIAEEFLQAGPTRQGDGAGLVSVSELEQEAAKLNRDREAMDDAPLRDGSDEASGTKELGDSAGNSEKPLASERALTAATLGNDAKTYEAQIESGTYRGQIIGETDTYVVQRVSSRSAVAHLKDSLDRQPVAGESVFINYSNGSALVRDFQQRTRERDLAR